jgi:predicted ester cyclase
MDSKTVVKAFWDSYCEGDLDETWDKFVSTDFVIHPASGFAFTRDSWKAAEQALMSSFDDVSVEILDQVAQGNKVATRWALTGVHKADFMGVPSSGRTATLTGTTFDVVENGQLVEHWAEVGVAPFLAQLNAEATAADPETGGLSDADQLALERLAVEVSWRVDQQQAATLPELFTENGTLATFGDPPVGHEALRAWGTMMDTEKPLDGVRHVLSNFLFDADGPDGASGTHYVTAYLQGAEPATVPFAMGIATDAYVRTPAGWKVKSRAFSPYFTRDSLR